MKFIKNIVFICICIIQSGTVNAGRFHSAATNVINSTKVPPVSNASQSVQQSVKPAASQIEPAPVTSNAVSRPSTSVGNKTSLFKIATDKMTAVKKSISSTSQSNFAKLKNYVNKHTNKLPTALESVVGSVTLAEKNALAAIEKKAAEAKKVETARKAAEAKRLKKEETAANRTILAGGFVTQTQMNNQSQNKLLVNTNNVQVQPPSIPAGVKSATSGAQISPSTIVSNGQQTASLQVPLKNSQVVSIQRPPKLPKLPISSTRSNPLVSPHKGPSNTVVPEVKLPTQNVKVDKPLPVPTLQPLVEQPRVLNSASIKDAMKNHARTVRRYLTVFPKGAITGNKNAVSIESSGF